VAVKAGQGHGQVSVGLVVSDKSQSSE